MQARTRSSRLAEDEVSKAEPQLPRDPASGLLGLQRQFGNKATTSLIQLQRACMLDAPPQAGTTETSEDASEPTATAPQMSTLLADVPLGGGGGGGGTDGGAGTTGGGLTGLMEPLHGGGSGPVGQGAMEPAFPGLGGAGGTGATGLARPMVKLGSSGLDVGHLQQLLNAAGAAPQLSTDGRFGPMTALAVRTFQKSKGLVGDGIVGPRTWAELDLGRDATPPTTTPTGPTPTGPSPAEPEPVSEPQTLREKLLAAMQAGKPTSALAAIMDMASFQELALLVSDPVFMAAYAKYQDAQIRKALFERLIVKYFPYTAAADALAVAETQVGALFASMSNASLQQTVLSSKIEIHIIPRDKNLTDLPPFAGLTTTADGRDWKDVRGIQKRAGTISYVGIAEETLTGGNRIVVDAATGVKTETPNRYGAGFMAAHETGHAIKASSLTPSQAAAVDAAYAKHLRDNPLSARQETHPKWITPAWYAASNTQEYFAQGVAAWRGTPRVESEAAEYTKANLLSIDPDLHAVLKTVFIS